MFVRITPPGRRARTFAVRGVRRSWDISGGCADASIPLSLSNEDSERILLAKVETFGATGLDWTGVVWRKPRYGAPLECAGQAIGLTHQRGPEFYGYGGFMRDLRVAGVDLVPSDNPDAFAYNINDGVVTIGIAPGATVSAGNGGRYYYWGDIPLASLDFSGWVNSVDVSLVIYSSLTPGSADTTVYTQTAGGEAAGQSVDLGGAYGFVIRCNADGAKTAVGPGFFVKAYDLRLHTTALASITASTIIGHILDQLPAYVLPAGSAYRRYVATTATVLDGIGFADPRDDLKKRIDTIVGLTDHHFGFYPRRIGHLKYGVPVFEPIPSTPTIALDARQAASENMRDFSAASLASDYIVRYEDQDGRSRYTAVDDADTAHYMNLIGYERTGIVDTPWTTSATTAAVAVQVSADAAERSAEGTMTITSARLINGRELPPTAVMPGMMARVMGINRTTRDLVVTHVEAIDSSVTVSFGNPLDLKHMLSRATRAVA